MEVGHRCTDHFIHPLQPWHSCSAVGNGNEAMWFPYIGSFWLDYSLWRSSYAFLIFRHLNYSKSPSFLSHMDWRCFSFLLQFRFLLLSVFSFFPHTHVFHAFSFPFFPSIHRVEAVGVDLPVPLPQSTQHDSITRTSTRLFLRPVLAQACCV